MLEADPSALGLGWTVVGVNWGAGKRSAVEEPASSMAAAAPWSEELD